MTTEPEPLVAARVFPIGLDKVREFTRALAELGEERGLIGPREAERIWSRHVLNSGVLAEVPTLREQGVDAVVPVWLAAIGPRNMAPPQIAFWDDVFARTMKTPEWKKFIVDNGWEYGFMPSAETASFLRKEYDEARGIMSDLGALKVDAK